MNNDAEVKRKRIGFMLETKAPAREGTKIITNDSSKTQVGTVTSGSPSPTLGKPIGMAYVSSKHSTVIKLYNIILFILLDWDYFKSCHKKQRI